MREDIEDLELRISNLENELGNKIFWDIVSFSIMGLGLIIIGKNIWEWTSSL